MLLLLASRATFLMVAIRLVGRIRVASVKQIDCRLTEKKRARS